MKKTLGLALGSGGARGAAHAGFLQALDEKGIKPNFIAGSSMGSVVGAAYANGMKPSQIKDLLLSIKGGDIFDVSLRPLTKLGLLKGHKVEEILKEHFGDMAVEDLKIPYCCVATDMLTGRGVTLGGKKSLAQSVLASSAIPSVFRPVRMDGMLLIDGGIVNRVPVTEVKNMGADVVVAVDVLGETKREEDVRNIFSVIMRTIVIMDYEITKNKRLEEANITDLWIEPQMGDISHFSLKTVLPAYDSGYETGLKNASLIKQLLK